MSDVARLSVSGLCAGYVPGMPIISAIDVSVGVGEIVAVIGPNGAGKSTLLKAIAGLCHIESGSIEVDGNAVTGTRTDKLTRQGIAFVPQIENIFRTMTVEQNLILAGRRCVSQERTHVEEMLSLFPLLKETYKKRAGALSGGQRQFLALAMALVATPGLLLLDEPTAGLSPIAGQEVLSILREIAKPGVGILLVEQNAKAALGLADRAYVLADGRNQHEGEAQVMLCDPVLGEIYLGGRRRVDHAAKPV